MLTKVFRAFPQVLNGNSTIVIYIWSHSSELMIH